MILRALLVILALLASSAVTGFGRAAAQDSERRTALVIGNGAYKVGPLINPVNDVRIVASSLGAARFKVIKLENATLEQMLKAISDFGDEIDKGGVGVFYFAGHGVQVGRQNYLIRVDANIDREEQIRTRAVNAQEVLDRMASAGNALNLLFLDACRNDPFLRLRPRRSRHWYAPTPKGPRRRRPRRACCRNPATRGPIASAATGGLSVSARWSIASTPYQRTGFAKR